MTAPVVLVKWYDWTKWLLDRVDSFPKNERFIFGQRRVPLAERADCVSPSPTIRPASGASAWLDLARRVPRNWMTSFREDSDAANVNCQ